jgi:flagella basal body P-ring formation protein FlgA
MTRLAHSGVLWSLALTLLLPAAGSSRGTKVSASALEGAVRTFLVERCSGSAVKPDITFRALPDGIDIPETTYTLHVSGDDRTTWKGAIAVRVEIESGGRIVHRCLVSVLIRTYADVLVAERPIGRHGALSADDVRALRMETTTIRREMLEEGAELGGLRSRQIVSRGSILYADLFERVPLVQQGDHVIVRVLARGVALSTEGIAREDGNSGEYVTIDLEGRHERVRARVDGARSVTVPLAVGKEN